MKHFYALIVFKSSVQIELSYQAIEYCLICRIIVGNRFTESQIDHISVILQNGRSRQGYLKIFKQCKYLVIFPAFQMFKISMQGFVKIIRGVISKFRSGNRVDR